MRRGHIVSLMALILAMPAAVAGSLFGIGGSASTARPCFNAGGAEYEFSAAKSATHVVRVDNAATHPGLRMQLVDDPAQADFVLVDDANDAGACKSAASIESIRVDPAAERPEFTVALSRAPADYRIFVRSAHYTDADAAALFAVMLHRSKASGALASLAKNG